MEWMIYGEGRTQIPLSLPTTINLLAQDLQTLENKQAKSAKLRANIIWELEGKKCFKTFLEVLDGKNMQNQTIFEPRRRQLPKLQLLNVLAKFLTERKYLIKTLTLARRKHKNSQTSNKFPGNDGLKAVL